MATQVFQNQTAFEIIIPTVNSVMALYPLEYVSGSYYLHIPVLVDVTSQNIDPLLIKYSYPETGPNIATTGVTSVLGVHPIATSLTGTTVTVSLLPLEASDIATGQVVKSVNTFTDTVSIIGGIGIGVTDNGIGTISVTNLYPGLTIATGVLPITLELSNSNQTLTGSIAVTPLIHGGAVALQTGTPVYQNDFAALRSLFLKSFADTDPFFRAYSSTDTLLASLDSEGVFYTQDVVANSVASPLFHVHETVAYDGTVYTVGDSRILLESSALGLSYFDIPFDVLDQVTLGKSTVTPGKIGNIIGLQEPTYVDPFVDLYTIPDQTTALIRLNSGYPSGTPNNNVYLDVVDNAGLSLIQLHDDGIVTAKKIEADVVEATTVFADNIFSSTLYVVGPDTIFVTTSGGPQSIIADCSNGPVAIQLPNLTTFTKSLKITAMKIDTTNYELSFVNGPNSKINGSTEALLIATQYAGKTLTSAGINWYITGTVG